MPDKSVYLIVSRAFVDEPFRRQLEADMEGTVKAMGLVLSDEALAELMTALDEGGDFASGLDQRLSQSGISLNPAALLRQKTTGGKQAAELGLQAGFSATTRARRQGKQVSKSAETTSIVATAPDEPFDVDEIDVEVEND